MGDVESTTNPFSRCGGFAEITQNSERIARARVGSNYRGNAQVVVSNVQYVPFGGASSMTYGNGLLDEWQFDLAYRPSSHSIGDIYSVSYTHDSDDNLMQVRDLIDSTRTQDFTYGLQGELLTETGVFGSKTYTYDENVNRLTRLFDDGATIRNQDLTYEPNSNRIATRNGNALEYDLAGNILFDGVGNKEYSYGTDGRLLSSSKDGMLVDTYRYDGGGARVLRETRSDTGEITSRYSEFYDAGQLLTEIKISPSGSRIERDIIWLDGVPIAQFRNRYRSDGSFRDEQTVFLHSDHLGAPRLGTNLTGTLVWRWESDAFGKGAATSDPDGDGEKVFVKLRLPGQIADSMTGKRYNFLRDYDQGLGRYLQSDPRGLDGGQNTYAYVDSGPTRYVDPTGEFRIRARNKFEGLEGQYEIEFWFEFTGSCLRERLDPNPIKKWRQAERLFGLAPDGYSGENDLRDPDLLCDCRAIDPKLKEFFERSAADGGLGYDSGSGAAEADEFTRSEATDILRKLKKEFERIVDEECDEDDDCDDLKDAYPWGRLLDLAEERMYPTNPRKIFRD